MEIIKSNFYLENQTVQYKRVYEIEGISEESLIEKLNGYLPSVSGLREINFNGSIFTGRVEKLMIDYKKFGGKWGNTWTALNFPINAILTIQVKENRYRVTLSDIQVEGPPGYGASNFDDLVTRKNKTEFIENKIVLNGMELMDKFLEEKFNLNSEKLDEDW